MFNWVKAHDYATLQRETERLRAALEECHDWLAQRVIDIIPEIDKPATEARINMARAVLDGSADGSHLAPAPEGQEK